MKFLPYFSLKPLIHNPKPMLKKYVFFIVPAVITLTISTLFSFKCSNEPSLMQNFNDNDYLKEWKTIDSLEQQGLPKSALEKVLALYDRVQKEDNPAQSIKCILYRSKYESQLEEDGMVKAIAKMETEISTAKSPTKALLQSIVAEFYNQYLQQNRWKIKERTNTVEFDNKDMQTWSMDLFAEKIMTLYKASIQDPELRSIRIKNFDAITSESVNTDQERPTLLDFLAHRAIDYFMNEQSYLTKPSFRFYLDDEKQFAPAVDFVKLSFKTEDSNSGKYNALVLLQELIEIHLNDSDKEALINADLKRLKFVKQNSTLSNKNELYLNALEQLKGKYTKSPASSEVLYEIGLYYSEQANLYQNDRIGHAEHQFDFVKALENLKKAFKKHPKSFGGKSSMNLINQIETKNFNLRTELVMIPNQPNLVSIDYRNLDKIHLKLAKIDYAGIKSMPRNNSKKLKKFFKNLDPDKTWNVNLPKPKDYQPHSTEIKLDALPIGQYILYASSDSKFKYDNNGFAYVILYVSNISHFYKKIEHNSIPTYVLTDRKTGQPLEGVKADFKRAYYDRSSRKQLTEDAGSKLSDSNGFVIPDLPPSNNNQTERYSVIFSKGNDVLDLNESIAVYGRPRNKSAQNSTQFFLDRKIYRPGQTVYFKALHLNRNLEGKPSILTNKDMEVIFYDVNGQKLDSKKLRTNEYGTVNGSFTAPKGGLLGRMRFSTADNSGSIGFRVEEYKRPKFEVKTEPVKGSYKLGDMVSLSGTAKAYAGSNIDGAEVKYRVVRNINYPCFPWWRYGRCFFRPPLQNKSEEIAFGSSKTDEKGKFSIEFEAKPDRTSKEEDQAVFTYQVFVDVVDITGETYSATGTARIGYVALNAAVGISGTVNSDSLSSISLSTNNLNGEFEPAKGTINIKSLKAPTNAQIKRFWAKPDQWFISESDYKKDFPQYVYQNEDDQTTWEVQNNFAQFDFDTEKSKEIDLSKNKLPAGAYLLELKTKDKFGTPIELRKYFTVYDLDDKAVPNNESFFHVMENKSHEPGEQAHFFVGSKNKPVHVLYELIHKNEIIHSEWLNINGLEDRKIKIKEEHRGNVHYALSMVYNNRIHLNQHTIYVPYSNKVLDIEFSTFRDKLYPGQDEEWRIKISGPKKEKAAAEMVAAMYDASLDVFAPNNWNNYFYPSNYLYFQSNSNCFNMNYGRQMTFWPQSYERFNRQYRQLNWFGFNAYGYNYGGYAYDDGVMLESVEMSPSANVRGSRKKESRKMMNANATIDGVAGSADLAFADSDSDSTNPVPPPEVAENSGKTEDSGFDDVAVRTNLNETVFFLPDLMTDADGNIIVKFKMNEALTRWKFMGFAHTKDLKTGMITKEIVTQKDLMVMPNPPRFFREGDQIEFTAKVSNLTENKMDGTATIQLFDAITNKPVNDLLGIKNAEIPFTAEAGQSARLAWNLSIPTGEVMAITHRVIAKSGKFSDGEESALPILTNRMLVTESLPLPVRGKETKKFQFKKLAESGSSNTLQNHKLTLEFTSNPAWYALQALPYLMEYPYDCTEQIFSRYYANSLATSVANSHPKIKSVFNKWRDSDAMLSNLSKNEELKSALLEETPWVLQAQSEELQRKNIGLLFDLNRMANERDQAMTKIAERQGSDGGFSWFPGGRDSWHITQHIVEGFGHLDALGVKSKSDDRISNITNRAVKYTDARLVDYYNKIKERVERGDDSWESDHLSQIVIHYLYSRSFYKEVPQDATTLKVADYFMGQVNTYWINKNQYLQGMLALAMHRNRDKTVPSKIVKSLKERSLYKQEMGMYWKYDRGYYWYQLPIETHAMMIEVFDEVANDSKAVDDLKVWLLKNKQTNHWKTTKATTAAVYALLSRGSNWLLEDALVEISLGGERIKTKRLKPEPGTGYIKTSWDGKDVKSNMANVEVKNPNEVVAWGALYWQYFEQLDKITTFEETPLTLKKQLFLEENTDSGPKISPVTKNTKLKPGDKLKVRIELRVDRMMEYVHMKDMRASGFEPMNTISQYKWKAGLGYYESTRDASTNFFFSRLPKGTHVFEYPLRVNHKGDFSNGITTIQCMYAPEFSSHSEGVRVTVD